jgi:hypothetical protein
MFRIFKKEKKTKNQKKTEKEKTTQKRKKPSCRHVNGPAQHRAHAGGAGIDPANGRSIGFATLDCRGGVLSRELLDFFLTLTSGK